jgi:hydroxymethylpyrimidine pyrophosphatase-like HAD family hydrolase
MDKIIAVDFDGTVVTHEYPDVGNDVPYAVEVLKRLDANGVKIILWTMRHGAELQDAVDWYEKKGIPLFGVNQNPQQIEWTQSPKCYAQVYVDDAALGCPVKRPMNSTGRPFVDWQAVEKLLQEKMFC